MIGLEELFINVRKFPETGWVTLVDGEAYQYRVGALNDAYGILSNVRGFYVLVHTLTANCFIGTGMNLANVVGNCKFHLRKGTHPNTQLQNYYSQNKGGDMIALVVDCNCVKAIYESTQWLMNHLRNRGQLLNTFFKTKVTGSADLTDDESVYGCYVLTHRPTGYFYIGTAKNPMGRKHTHLYRLKAGNHVNPDLQSLWNRTEGKDWCWDFKIFGDKEAAYDHEQGIIDDHFGKPGTLLLNRSSDARDNIAGLMTPDIRKKAKEGAAAAIRTLFSQAVVVDGVEYPSATAAAEALGTHQTTVSRWANNPNNTKAHWKNKDRPEYVDGKVRKVNTWRDDAARVARRGAGNPFAKKIVVKNVTYGSVKEAQFALKIGEKMLRKWANDPTNFHVYWG